MEALDKLLGRSTIDPSVKEIFEEGRIEDLLAEYKFPPEVLHQLRDIQARDFNDYTKQAYQIVESIALLKDQIAIPDPMEGLCPELIFKEKEQVA